MVLEGMKQERRTERDPSQRTGERWKSLWLGFLKATLSPLLPSLFPLWQLNSHRISFSHSLGTEGGHWAHFWWRKHWVDLWRDFWERYFVFWLTGQKLSLCPPYLLEMLSWGQNLTTMKQNHKDKDNTLRLAEQKDALLGNLTVIETLSEPWKYLFPGFL